MNEPVERLKKQLILLKNPTYNSIDRLMRRLCKYYGITPEKLHNDFKKSEGMIPDNWIKSFRKFKK
jgi:methylphosphotriester-DNA--protein-cysteine methyltransferase